MPVVKPFRGIRYNPKRIQDFQTVVSQPYDKISEEFQQKYYDLSPYNIVRIIKGKTCDGDAPGNPDGPNVYTRANEFFQQWQAAQILIREETPAFYAFEQTFGVNGQEYTRHGLIAAVELTGFDKGVIRPHERTHRGPKQDRLRLLQTLRANTEQILMLYPDPKNEVNELVGAAIAGHQPAIDINEIQENEVRQRLWIITDPEVLQAIQVKMAPMRNLIIADGHHRYETGLNYRDAQRTAHPDAPPNATFNFIAVTLVSMDDPGLVILPAHREIRNFDQTSPAAVLERASAQFEVSRAPDLDACMAQVNAHPAGHTFGFYGGPETGFYVLKLKDSLSAEARDTLGVCILHEEVLAKIALVPRSGIEDKSMIRYHRVPQPAIDSVDHGPGVFAFFVSPTRIEHVKSYVSRGEKMPQKSTDFYPKVISGFTLMPMGAGEQL